MKTDEHKLAKPPYHLGRLLQHGEAAMAMQMREIRMSFPRPLIDATGHTVGYVDSDAGPAVIGELTRDEVIERWGLGAFCGSF